MTEAYLSDTNVVSETSRSRPNPQVLSWLSTQSPIRLSAVTVYELRHGVMHSPPGRRRDFLEAWLQALLAGPSVIESFDREAALAAATIERESRRKGRPIADRDLFIAATAASRGVGVATRDIGDFQGRGIALYDPFTGAHIPA